MQWNATWMNNFIRYCARDGTSRAEHMRIRGYGGLFCKHTQCFRHLICVSAILFLVHNILMWKYYFQLLLNIAYKINVQTVKDFRALRLTTSHCKNMFVQNITWGLGTGLIIWHNLFQEGLDRNQDCIALLSSEKFRPVPLLNQGRPSGRAKG